MITYFEVCEFGGRVYYHGAHQAEAQATYDKLAGLGYPVQLAQTQVLAVTKEFEAQQKSRANAVPWAR